MNIKRKDFEYFLNSIACCYSKDCSHLLPKLTEFPNTIFDRQENLDITQIISFANTQENVFVKSISRRITAIYNIIQSRDNDTCLDIYYNWKLISESILLLPCEFTIASIGSQGFLSIPLYKNDKDIKSFDFIRLHIWDESLNQYINKETCSNFSIHSHTFHAHSWVITGNIINDRYKIIISNQSTSNSLFTIEYNKSISEVNKHTSNAVNTYVNILSQQLSHEVYMPGSAYQIKAGDYHKSGCASKDGLSATFFSFTAKNSLIDNSHVVGPSSITNSEINRKINIDPNYLLEIIDAKMATHDRKTE
jgi:hypothetical protein